MRKSPPAWVCVVAAAMPAGCTDADLASGLITRGPPSVSAVLVTGESRTEPTYCNPDMGDHTPHVCHPGEAVDPVGDVRPLGWTARVVFKELLDPSIEDIDARGDGSIRRADPFAITCGGAALGYDGFYDPSGNHDTSPVGPALVIFGLVRPAVAAGTSCDIAINPGRVRDKDGEAAPTGVSFQFTIAPLHAVTSVPPAGATDVEADARITLVLNSHVAAATLAAGIHLTDAAGAAVAAAIAISDADPTAIAITPDAALAPGAVYHVTASTDLEDTLGGALATPFELTFTTRP